MQYCRSMLEAQGCHTCSDELTRHEPISYADHTDVKVKITGCHAVLNLHMLHDLLLSYRG